MIHEFLQLHASGGPIDWLPFLPHIMAFGRSEDFTDSRESTILYYFPALFSFEYTPELLLTQCKHGKQ